MRNGAIRDGLVLEIKILQKPMQFGICPENLHERDTLYV